MACKNLNPKFIHLDSYQTSGEIYLGYIIYVFVSTTGIMRHNNPKHKITFRSYSLLPSHSHSRAFARNHTDQTYFTSTSLGLIYA
jgi:hypothetical protein